MSRVKTDVLQATDEQWRTSREIGERVGKWSHTAVKCVLEELREEGVLLRKYVYDRTRKSIYKNPNVKV